MKKEDISRRNFIETSALGTVAVLAGCKTTTKLSHDARGLPTAILGKTGVRIPRIAVGCGSRFMAAEPDAGLEMLEYALDHGLYYWDTANSYAQKDRNETSEERLGKILKSRRKEVFLSTKLGSREPDEMKRQFEASLKRLQTDHVDILNLHAIRSLEDAQSLEPLVKILEDYRRQGMTRFIGFTGHDNAAGMAFAADNYGLDFMLCALNQHQKGEQPFEGDVHPIAARRKMGIMVMKVIRPRETVESVTPKQLIRYALSLPHPHGAIIAMQDLDVMKANVDLLKSFQPMSEEELQGMSAKLEPFFRSQDLPWLQPGYRDGGWV